MSKFKSLAASSVLVPCLFANTLHAENVSFFDMSLEELMDIEVTIASKSEEKSFAASSAISVLTNEDIKRSGATTIAEALKLLPGVFVSEFGGDFRVSVRGFNNDLTDKLLVLMDGRTVYTPLFSGVYWDEVDTFFDDIDRIEVVRGPGATLWGANAVNGVINIITKNAKDTVGTTVYALAGDYDKFESSARHGMKLTEDSYFRSYAKFFERGNSNNKNNNNDFFDDRTSSRAGFRYDNDLNEKETLKIQGDAYVNRLDVPYYLDTDLDTVFDTIEHDTDETSGGNVLAKWQKKHDNNGSLSVQAYIDYTNRETYTLGDQKYTYDLEIQRNTKINKHELIVGAGYRYVADSLDNTDITAGDPYEKETDLVNAFIQDKYPLYSDKLFITIGSKFSHNDYTHFEHQPSVRFSLLPNDKHTFWTSVSKAVRIPNRKENDPSKLQSYNFISNTAVESEELIAYEAGYRTKAIKDVFLDITAFYNSYDKLSTTEASGYDLYFSNNANGHTYGYEVSANWQVQDNWKLMANYSYIDMSLKDPTGSLTDSSDTSLGIEDQTPDNILNIRSLTNFGRKWEWDNIFYYWSKISTADGDVSAYKGFTTRIAYKPDETQEISLVVKDLFDPTHNEDYVSTVDGFPEIERRFYVKYAKKF